MVDERVIIPLNKDVPISDTPIADNDSDITFEPDKDGNRVNVDESIAPPVKTTDIYPPLKNGETV